jgi:hypothetical protein
VVTVPLADNSDECDAMRKLALYIVTALAMLGSVQKAGYAQGGAMSSACRPADSTSASMVAWLTAVVTGTDSAAVEQRTQMKLPKVAASQITYVTDENVCSKALSPYNANSTMSGNGVSVPPSGQLYVVKVGTVYVARDPAKTAGEFVINVTLDSKFRFLAAVLG